MGKPLDSRISRKKLTQSGFEEVSKSENVLQEALQDPEVNSKVLAFLVKHFFVSVFVAYDKDKKVQRVEVGDAHDHLTDEQ